MCTSGGACPMPCSALPSHLATPLPPDCPPRLFRFCWEQRRLGSPFSGPPVVELESIDHDAQRGPRAPVTKTRCNDRAPSRAQQMLAPPRVGNEACPRMSRRCPGARAARSDRQHECGVARSSDKLPGATLDAPWPASARLSQPEPKLQREPSCMGFSAPASSCTSLRSMLGGAHR